MILDLPKFVANERPAWNELETLLDHLQDQPDKQLTLAEATRFHFLYQKVSADLGRLATFASEPQLLGYLESLVARAYGEIHGTRERGRRRSMARWFVAGFPRAFRNRTMAFIVSVLVTLLGVGFGGFAVALDDEAKQSLVPAQFAHLLSDPAERVAWEESQQRDRHGEDTHATFAGMLMVNNIRVSIMATAMGMTWGAGTVVALFYNGVILGLTAVDYILAGQTMFLLGWLMPHGAVEIPAVLIAGQAGIVLGGALIGRKSRASLRDRLRAVGPDVAHLLGGVAVMLVWAGIVESFFSQYHQPVLPYWVKIAFGTAEFGLLVWFLSHGAKRRKERILEGGR
jgi:uncharacterized membrane protein SpoIIM required for sporulation